MLLVFAKTSAHRQEELRLDTVGLFKAEEAFEPMPPGVEYRIYNVELGEDGWPKEIKRKRRGHRRTTTPQQKEPEVKVIG